MSKITVLNDGVEIEGSAAISLLNTLLRAGIAIDHRCGGKAQCGTCRVRVVDGMEHTSPRREAELAKLEKFGSPPDLRLACQTYIAGDVTIEIQSRRSRRDENSR